METGHLAHSLASFTTRVSSVTLLGILLIFGGRAFALDPALQLSQYVVDTWQSPEGLPQNAAEAIARTPDGYLWIGTQEGLARFDGNRFTVFDRSNEAALPDKLISALYVDRSGRLWIGTRDGLAVFENGRFSAYTQFAALRHASIRVILEDSVGRIWVGTDNGLIEIDGNTSKTFGISEGLRDPSIRGLLEDHNHRLWVTTATGGLHRLAGGAVETPQFGPDTVADPISAMYEDRDGALWFGTANGRLYRRADEHTEAVASRGQLGQAVHALTRDHDGNMWIATYGAGLVRLRDGIFSTLESGHFPGNDLRVLYEDNEGSLWVGTFGDGLSRLRNGKFTPFGEAEGLQGNNVWSIVPRASGGIWIGTDAGLSDYNGNTIQHIAAPPGFEKVRVAALLEDRKGALWVGTDGAGVYSRENDRVTAFNRDSGLSGNSVKAIAEDRHGRVWIGTEVGIDRIEQGKITSVQTLLEVSGPTAIRLIQEDSAGKMWVATRSHGLFIIDGLHVRHLGLADGLPSASVTAIYEDERQVVWIGTTEGLALWRNGRVVSLAATAGPLHETILQVLEDDQHRMWLTSNNGLASVPRAALDALAIGGIAGDDVRVYTVADGLRTVEFDGGNTSPGCRTPDGRLWFPSIRGIVEVDPTHLRVNTLPPPVQIENVSIDGVLQPLTQRLDVKPGGQQWEFHYTALSLLNAQRTRFRYRLEGFDQRWIEAKNRRIAYYTQLPPGTFTFHVIASNDDGVWNNSGASFRVTVQPHFYQTLWFILLCISGLSAILIGLHRLRVGHLSRLAFALRREVAARTQELKQSNTQLEKELVEHKAAEDALREHDALLKVVTRSAAELLGPYHDDAISMVLELIGQTLGVNRAQLCTLLPDSDGHMRSSIRYEWCEPGATGMIDNLAFNDLDLTAHFGKAIAPVLAGQIATFFIDDICGMYRPLFEDAKMRSFLQLPLHVEEKLWGSLNFFDSRGEERKWSWAETDTLKTLAELIGMSITRARYVKELADANAIVQNSPTILYRLRGEPSFPLIYVSHNINKFGHDPKQLLVMPNWARTLVDPDDMAKVSAAMASMLEHGTLGAAIEFRLRTGDGARRWVENRYTPVRDKEGRLVEIEGIIVDITERKAAEDKIALLARTDALTSLVNRATFIDGCARHSPQRSVARVLLPCSTSIWITSSLSTIRSVIRSVTSYCAKWRIV